MKNFKKDAKGITLLALVVTIIILIILATVSVNILVMDNGLIQKATGTGELAKDVTEDEHVKLAVADALITGAGKLSTDNVKNALKSEFGEEKVTDETLKGTGPWTFKGDRNTYTIEATGNIQSKPPIKKDILTVENFTELNYGDYITNYGIDIDGDGNDEDDWRIFYIQDYKGEGVEGDNLPAQGKRIFLIASDYVRADMPELKEAATNAKMSSGDGNRADYVKYWNSSDYPELNNLYPGDSEEVSLFPNLFVFDKFAKGSGKQDFWDSQKCAASLLNVKNWERFTKEGISDYAVGAPTLGMFVKSWNSCHDGSDFLSYELYTDGSCKIGMGLGTGVKHSNYVTLSRG